ncbi:alpha/beta hydrolase [Glonium stellatum]|uniref:Alpha/beta hydrolase n=1 Tax=Glonium stellatum TaxID=574774 RepID=A0A8E2JS78_9PEZI|nr:alpha/beta hydrolase [Glonium stellatum]
MTSSQSLNDWDVTTKSTLVSIGTHSLFFSISGPPRRPHEPIVVVFTGSGDCGASWVAVERLVSPFARILIYDRSGLGRSEDGPNRAVATVAAEELHLALESAGIRPPFVLCAHSYGGVVAREFLHRWPDAVVGMVLAEAATEHQSRYFRVRDPNMDAVAGDLNFARVTGLRDDAKLSREEWRTRAAQFARGAPTAEKERKGFFEVCDTLREKKQFERQAFGTKPLSVIRCNNKKDQERIYQKGVEAGNGTEEQRRAFRELLDSWEEMDAVLKEEQLLLSQNSRLVHLPDCGHNVQLIRPDVVADEVRWVLERSIEGRKASNL